MHVDGFQDLKSAPDAFQLGSPGVGSFGISRGLLTKEFDDIMTKLRNGRSSLRARQSGP